MIEQAEVPEAPGMRDKQEDYPLSVCIGHPDASDQAASPDLRSHSQEAAVPPEASASGANDTNPFRDPDLLWESQFPSPERRLRTCLE